MWVRARSECLICARVLSGCPFHGPSLSDLLNPRYLGFQLLLLLITHTQILFPSTSLANVIIQAYCDCRMNERKKEREEEKKRGCFTQIRSFYLIKNRKSLLFTKERLLITVRALSRRYRE